MTPFPFLRFTGQVLSIFFLLLSAVSSQAHNSSKGLTAVNIQIFTNRVEAQLAVSFFDVGMMLTLDKNKDGTVTAEEVQVTLKELEGVATKELEFYFDGKRVMPSQASASLQESNFETQFVFDVPSIKGFTLLSTIIRQMTPDHQQFVTVTDAAGTTLAEATLSPADIMYQYGSGSGQTATSFTSGKFVTFLKHGIKHILGGYDHLLFLFALLIVCDTFWSLAKIITCFTLAHSISLALSTLNILSMPASVVEPIVALTIVYVGLENLFKLKTLQWRWLVTFAFGLIHGFAFANELRDKGIGAGNIFIPLLSFNLGVELGQILIAALVLPILWQLKKLPQFMPRWVPVTSVIVILLGGYWFVDRVWLQEGPPKIEQIQSGFEQEPSERQS
ncbi:MAG: HupE/UreJ family protein [Verrucomicrobia bacterium]|nr:HupE/UreJ family protein [Verrucomicrobiota bacterium]